MGLSYMSILIKLLSPLIAITASVSELNSIKRYKNNKF